MQENDSLPQDLSDLLYNHLNETFELDKEYNINYFQNKEPRFELEEIDSINFKKPLNFYSYGNNVFLSEI